MEIYEYKMEQILKKFAHDKGICKFCLNICDKPCIFRSNNDEHICPIIEKMYEYSGGEK